MKYIIISLLLMTSLKNYKLIEFATIENIRGDEIHIIDKDILVVATNQSIKIVCKNKIDKNYDLKGYFADKIYWDDNKIYSSNFIINTQTNITQEIDFLNINFESKNSNLHDISLYDYDLMQTAWNDKFTGVTILLNYRSPRNSKVEEAEIPRSILLNLTRGESDNLILNWQKEYQTTIPSFFQLDKKLYLINGFIEQISADGLTTEIGEKDWNIRNLIKSDENIYAYSNKKRLYEINLDRMDYKFYDEKIPNIIHFTSFTSRHHIISDDQSHPILFDSNKREFQSLAKPKDKILSISSNSNFIVIGYLAPIPYLKLYFLESH